MSLRDKSIWLVEMWVDLPFRRRTAHWEPTTAAALTKAEAEVLRREYRQHDPSDRFRVRRYVRRGPQEQGWAGGER